MAIDVNTIYETALWMLITLGVSIILWFVIYVRQFKHKITIKHLVNSRKYIIQTKARDYKDKDGVEFWQIWDSKKIKGTDIIPKPPTEAIEITPKGKKFAEVYRDEYHNYFYAIDTNSFKEVPEEYYNLERYDEKLTTDMKTELEGITDTSAKEVKRLGFLAQIRNVYIDHWVKTNRAIVPLKPFTTNQRIIQVNQHQKKLALRGKSLKDFLFQIAPMLILAIAFIGGMMFIGDAIAPVQEIKQIQLQEKQEVTKQLELLRDIKGDLQVLKSQEKGGGALPDTPPN